MAGIQSQLAVLPSFTDDVTTVRNVMGQVASRATQLGFHPYNTLDDFDSRWPEYAVSTYDGHPNAAAHARLASRMFQEMERHVPADPRAKQTRPQLPQ